MAEDSSRKMRAIFIADADALRRAIWRPAADLYRTDNGWVIKLDLAGVRSEDISVALAGRYVSVRGTRRDQLSTAGCHQYRMEISYSHFERTIELPSAPESARIATEHRDGMLLVHIETEESTGD